MADQILQDIKDRLNIADIISGYIQIKKAGTNFKALCPFHHEKTPSLQISPQKQIWHCFGCFPPGEKVKTPFGLHNIESIDEKHYVYSGQGKIRRILATHKRRFSGELISVKTRKLGGIVRMTSDHHLQILRPKTKYARKTKQFYRQCRADVKKGKCQYVDDAILKHADLLQVNAGELNTGDFALYPVNQSSVELKKINLRDYLNKSYTYGPRPAEISYTQIICENLLKLIGYYVAEGSSHRAYIRFSLGNHEEKFASEIVYLIGELFGIEAKIYRRKNSKKTGLEITACHSYLANIFENLCGKGAGNKHIPFVFQELPIKSQKILIEAIHKGDGHNYIANKSRKLHRSITTVSRILAEQLVDMLVRSDLYPSFRSEKAKIDKKSVHHKEAYTVVWSEEAEPQHNFVISNPDGSKYWLLPIKTVIKKHYDGLVYNLTVEKDHTYIATNFVVGNCGEGGDVFGFVMKYENLEFKDALKFLADKAGVKLPEYRPAQSRQQQDEKELLYRINDFAARLYHQILVHEKLGGYALEYLTQRGLTLKTIEQWQIGFAPNDFHVLEEALKKKGANIVQAVKAGVLAKNERGQVYDRFRGRITFPIFDYMGQIVGFSARILPQFDDGKSAKYVNSPETLIYNKSKTLFGLNFAKDAIRKKNEVVIVEGQMDCITAHQAGFNNTVASSGTALTEYQLTDKEHEKPGSGQNLAQLQRLTKNLKFCFDTDSAGLKALRRAGEIALKQGFRSKVVVLKNVKDPDDLIKKSPGLWEKAVSEAVWFLDYYINFAEEEFSKDPIEQKHYLSEQVIPLLGFITDALEQDHYIIELAKRFEISEKVIRGQIKNNNFSAKAEIETAGAQNNQAVLQKEILGGVLFDQNFAKEVIEEAEITDFEDLGVYSLLLPGFEAGDMQKIDKSAPLAKESLFMVESMEQELEGGRDALTKQLKKSLAILRLNALKKRQTKLGLEIKTAEKEKNKEKISELNALFAKTAALRVKFEKTVH